MALEINVEAPAAAPVFGNWGNFLPVEPRVTPDYTNWLENRPLDYYTGVRWDVVSLIPPDVRSVLEVGCAAGHTGRVLRESGIDPLIGIEINPRFAESARAHYSDLIIDDAENCSCIAHLEDSLDCLLYPDVLEHFRNPWGTLHRHTAVLRRGGWVIASIPNVRYYKTVRDLVFRGTWDYADGGVLDKGHLRFFTRASIEGLFQSSGLSVLSITSKLRGTTILRLMNRLTVNRLQPFLVKQYLVVARKDH